MGAVHKKTNKITNKSCAVDISLPVASGVWQFIL